MSDAQSTPLLPVLIVGAGPVGLMMATCLHHHGISCRIIDKSPQPTTTSKALVIWGRTQEILDDLGILTPFSITGIYLDAACLHGGSRLLARIPFKIEGTEYPRPLMIAQCDTERLLTEHLSRVRIQIERQVELTGLVDQGDRVQATLRYADGRVEELQVAWLLGCDGSHSTVRKQVGLEFTGEAEQNDWILADCKIDGISQTQLSLFWHTKGVLAFFPFTENRCRIIADMGMAKTEHRPPDPSLAEVQQIVDDRGLPGVRLSEPHWLAGFRIHERKVSDYRRGRIFLAGDSAHIHSPAGGQGMNTGMQDAYNLAWKLALVQKGQAQSSLLDSYNSERSDVGEVVLRQAGRMTRMATMRNRIGQFFRNRIVGIVGQLPVFRRNFTRYLSELAVHYPNSPLNAQTGRDWSSKSVVPGDRLPDTRLCSCSSNQEERLLAILRGPQYKLLLLPCVSPSSKLEELTAIGKWAETTFPSLIRSHLIVPSQRAEGIASTWCDPFGSVRKFFGGRQSIVVLVRPDGYIAYRGQPASKEDLNNYLSRYLLPG